MQEIIRLVTTIRKDIEELRTLVSRLTLTHARFISEEWITSDQVMFILKIGISSLKTLKRSGKLPYSKINGVSYFRTVDVENLLKHHYNNPSSNDNHPTFNTSPDEEG